VLGTNGNLWLEHGPFGTVPPPRQQVDGNVALGPPSRLLPPVMSWINLGTGFGTTSSDATFSAGGQVPSAPQPGSTYSWDRRRANSRACLPGPQQRWLNRGFAWERSLRFKYSGTNA
jgi:hypothetical protein